MVAGLARRMQYQRHPLACAGSCRQLPPPQQQQQQQQQLAEEQQQQQLHCQHHQRRHQHHHHQHHHHHHHRDHRSPPRPTAPAMRRCRPKSAKIKDYDAPAWKFWLFCLLCIVQASAVRAEVILRIDPLALLSATLRTYQKVACDTDQVVIACPRGTSISIEFAQYNKFIAKDGISIDELCPAADTTSAYANPANKNKSKSNSNNVHNANEMRAKAKHLLRGSTFGSPLQTVPANRYANAAASLIQLNAAAAAAAAAILSANSTSRTAAAAAGTSGDAAGVLATPAGTAVAANGAAAADDNTPENCMWPNALQYSLLQTVVEACQKKKHCKFNGTPEFYGLGSSGVGDTSGTSSYHSSTISSSAINVDPCPKRRKIVEVAYKCRPYEFRSKVACHNDVAQLECNPYSRIVVYSASFGRTEYESIQCPQPQGVREETCLASYATETVMQICHGRRRCNLAADANTFGSPCQPNSRMYLKVVYTCVPKQVLKDRYETEMEADEQEDFEGDFNELYDDELNYKESEAIPKLYSNTTVTTSTRAGGGAANATNSSGGGVGAAGAGGGAAGANNANSSLGFDSDSGAVNPVMTHSADLSLEDNHERFYLYLLIVGFLGVILCIVIVAVRVIVVRRDRDTHSPPTTAKNGGGGGGAAGSGMSAETTIPNGFNDTISEIDADIDLTTPIPVPSVSKNENYITYGTATSIYGSLGPSNISHTSSTLLLQGGATTASGSMVGGAGTGTTSLIANPLTYGAMPDNVGARQSPDIIGISSGTFLSGGGGNLTAVSGILTPAIVIGSSASINHGNSSSIGTVVPIASLAQYTTAPTFRAGYIISPEAVLQQQQQQRTATPPTSMPIAVNAATAGGGGGGGSATYTCQFADNASLAAGSSSNISGVGGGGGLTCHMPATSTLRRGITAKSMMGASPPMLQQQPSYDGTAPRTLSTGVPVNSQFYYG